ncbi:MAG: MurR/RpiR family transcriptional regulator, partial [Rubrivivax sp.]|nr:MurR/RpiR family transcriptional regulator [Rubrivivax sp.]
GFEGFEELRRPFVNHLAGGLPMAALQRTDPTPIRFAAAPEASAQLNLLQQRNVASVLALNTAARIEAAADAMLQAKNVYFLGLRVCHGVAFHLHYVYGLLAANGTLINDLGGTMADQITRLERDDLLIAISQSPYTRQTVEGVQLAHEQGAAVLAMTDAALAPIARRAQHVLLFETATSSFFQSTLGAEALAEALVATLAARGGVAAQRRLRQMQEHLRRTRAYWERPASARAPRTNAETDPMEISN